MADLPTGWQVWYEDGSTYSSERGDNWRQLPTTNVTSVLLSWGDGRSAFLVAAPFTWPGVQDDALSGPGLIGSATKYEDLIASSDF